MMLLLQNVQCETSQPYDMDHVLFVSSMSLKTPDILIALEACWLDCHQSATSPKANTKTFHKIYSLLRPHMAGTLLESYTKLGKEVCRLGHMCYAIIFAEPI